MNMKILNLFDNKQFIPQIADWIYEAFIDGIREGIALRDVTHALSNRHKKTMPLTYLGIVNGECVGTVSLVSNDLKSRGDLTPWLAALYIREEDRGQGYGQELIEKAIETARELGFRKLYLRTETAADYYKKVEWKKIDETIDRFNLYTEVFEKDIS